MISQSFEDVLIEEGGTLDLYLHKEEAELRPFSLTGTIVNYGTVKIRGLLNNEGFIENWGTIDGLRIVNVNETSILNNWGTLKTITPIITQKGVFNNCGEYLNWMLEQNPNEAKIIQIKPPQDNCSIQGAVSLWKADGTLDDSLGSNHGNALTIQYGPGLRGEAFSFSGEDTVVIGNPQDLKIDSEITLEAWVQTEDLEEGQFAPIITKWAQDPEVDSYGLTLWKRDGLIELAGAVVTPTGMAGLVNGAITPYIWTHVAMSYNGTSGDQRIFVDGSEVAWQSKPGGIRISDLDVIIGSEDSTEPRHFIGLIDDLAIYNKTLTVEQIQTNMQMGSPSGLSREGLDFDGLDIPSPLAQQKYLDILPQDVTCKVDLELLITPLTGRAACVDSSNVDKIIGRGWIAAENYDSGTRGSGGGGLVISGNVQE